MQTVVINILQPRLKCLDENKKPLYQCSESGIFLGESDDPEYQHRCIQKLEKTLIFKKC